MNVKNRFIDQLRSSHASLKLQPLETLISENLISPFELELPVHVLTQAQSIIETIFKMREQSSYVKYYQRLLEEHQLSDPGNKSILMSYDFHVDQDENLKLIEINTNAAFLTLGEQMYRARELRLPIEDFNILEIKSNIEEELRLQKKSCPNDLKIAIVDDNPHGQRLFVEFLVYDALFKSWGWNSRILDYRELLQVFQPDFVYNRHTDFFLSDPANQLLREKFLAKKVCLSPNPFEYFLLADKQRLIDWLIPGFLQAQGLSDSELNLLQTCLPKSLDVTPENASEIWSQRKNLFFKPKNSFGSKQSFRGESISRKAFKETLGESMIAQEFIAAPERVFETPTGQQTFKYDLRCYAYKGRLQMVVARLYQGQVTNLRTPLGGFAPVLFQ
jgi:hypothetical protein